MRRPRRDVSVQNLLLGSGTALIAVATVIFTAVNWERLDATFQGLVLVAITVVAGTAASACARRAMPATAEALGAVTVLLALAVGHAFRVGLFSGVPIERFWAGALAAVAVVAWALGWASGIRSPQVAAAVLGQAPLLVLLAGGGVSITAALLLVLAQVAVVAVVAGRPGGAVPVVGAVARSVASVQWLAVLTVAAFLASVEPDRRVGTASVLGVAAAVAALVAWRRSDDDEVRPVASGAAALVGLAAVALGLGTLVAPDLAVATTALLAAAVVAVALRVPRAWGSAPAGAAGLVGLLASTPILGGITAVLVAASEVPARAWDLPAATRATSLAVEGTTVGATPLAVHLVAALAFVLAVRPVISRRAAASAAVGVAAAAVACAPLLLPLSVGGSAVAAFVGAAVASGVAAVGRSRPTVLAPAALTAAGTTALGLIWASADPVLTLAAVAGAGVVALTLLVAARAAGAREVGVGAAGAVVAAMAAGAGLGAAAGGSSSATCWAGAGATALLVALVAALLLDPEGGDRSLDGSLSMAAEGVAWAVHAVALAVAVGGAEADALRVVLGAGALAGALHSSRVGRRPLAWLAAGQAVVLAWVQLGNLGVQAPEPYVLPVAAVLLAAGLVARRRAVERSQTLESWIWLGPALVVTFVPSVAVSFVDRGLLRPLMTLAAAGIVLAAGSLTAKRAAVDVGLAVVTVLGLRQLAPVVGGLPNWATIAATGTLLLVVGATFEQRRRDLHHVRHRYASFD